MEDGGWDFGLVFVPCVNHFQHDRREGILNGMFSVLYSRPQGEGSTHHGDPVNLHRA